MGTILQESRVPAVLQNKIFVYKKIYFVISSFPFNGSLGTCTSFKSFRYVISSSSAINVPKNLAMV